jgi:hypothetical protein
MRAKRDKSSESKAISAAQEYCHPLRLQSLSPDRFLATVNKILNGELTLLIDRIRH